MVHLLLRIATHWDIIPKFHTFYSEMNKFFKCLLFVNIVIDWKTKLSSDNYRLINVLSLLHIQSIFFFITCTLHVNYGE